MKLEEKLSAIRAGAAQKIPADKLTVMTEATRQLRDSGILDGVLAVGASLPRFELESARGVRVDSSALLAQGPLVLTVFRGHW